MLYLTLNSRYTCQVRGASSSEGISLMVHQCLVSGIASISSHVVKASKLNANFVTRTKQEFNGDNLWYFCSHMISVSYTKKNLLNCSVSNAVRQILIIRFACHYVSRFCSAGNNSCCCLAFEKSVIAVEREKWVDLDWLFLQGRGCVFGGLKGRFHGQHFKLISWIKQLNQNPCLFTRQDLCKTY